MLFSKKPNEKTDDESTIEAELTTLYEQAAALVRQVDFDKYLKEDIETEKSLANLLIEVDKQPNSNPESRNAFWQRTLDEAINNSSTSEKLSALDSVIADFVGILNPRDTSDTQMQRYGEVLFPCRKPHELGPQFSEVKEKLNSLMLRYDQQAKSSFSLR